MSAPVKARIRWIPAAAGGRPSPPTGPRYSTVARFEADAASWPERAWSIVAEFHGPPDETLCTIANVQFLIPEAPTHLLRPGGQFELYEGRRLVARGEVLALEPACDRPSTRQSPTAEPTEVVDPAPATPRP